MPSLTFQRASKKPRIFLRLTGLTIEEFLKMCSQTKPVWKEEVESKKKSAGRNSRFFTLEDKVLALAIYYRTYITHEFLGFLFNAHNSNVSRLFKVLEPVCAKTFTIKKDRTLTEEKILELLVDVMEQPIQRPKKKKKQKESYSGKKKRHTIKTEVVMDRSGKIVKVSRSRPGKIHDFRMRTEGEPLPFAEKIYVDLGYQGHQKIRKETILPIKRKKGKTLTQEEKRYNRDVSRIRVRIENKIREIKTFKITGDVYRNFGKKQNLRVNIIAGIVNMKNGF